MELLEKGGGGTEENRSSAWAGVYCALMRSVQNVTSVAATDDPYLSRILWGTTPTSFS
jgi:hypothetical protein